MKLVLPFFRNYILYEEYGDKYTIRCSNLCGELEIILKK
jgi:hypothetical protein